MKIVINADHGGFGLSDAAYIKLHEWGVPIKKHVKAERLASGLYKDSSENEGEVIFENDGKKLFGSYWDLWSRDNRSHPLLVRVVEELGTKASDSLASLKVVEIPDGVEWEIQEYDGAEWVAEKHRTWR